MRNSVSSIAVVALVAACGTPGSNPDGGIGSNEMGGLEVVSFTSTVQTLVSHPTATETDTVTFVAIVTDAKGLDTIAGGSLMDDQGTTYAGFGAGATKGTYTAAVSWDTVDSIRAIDYPDDHGARTFVAKFFDNDGNEVTAGLEVALRCRVTTNVPLDPDVDVSHMGDFGSAHAGTCFLARIDPDHCGTFDTACGDASYCLHGTCSAAADRHCFTGPHVPRLQSCAEVCAALGMTCPSQLGGYSYWNNPTCANDDWPLPSSSCTSSFRELPIADQYGMPVHCYCQ